jgi:hypothetical protein
MKQASSRCKMVGLFCMLQKLKKKPAIVSYIFWPKFLNKTFDWLLFCTGSAVPRGGEHDQRQSRQPLPRVGCAHRALLTLYTSVKILTLQVRRCEKMHFLQLMTSINEFWYFEMILSTRLVFFCVFSLVQERKYLRLS